MASNYTYFQSDSGCIWKFPISCGQSSVDSNNVKDLYEDLHGKGHTLFTDGYYTSPTLANELKKEDTALDQQIKTYKLCL